jgi:hypothetical protein
MKCEIDMMTVVVTALMRDDEGKVRDKNNIASARGLLSEVAIVRSPYRIELEAGLS